jgi:hypothetical protein
VRALDRPITVLLVYPATSSLHSTEHDLLFSPDGRAWEALETTDAPTGQQAEGEVPDLGYVMVAGVPAPPVTPTPGGEGGGGTPSLALILLVAAGVVLLIGIGLLVRSRGGPPGAAGAA